VCVCVVCVSSGKQSVCVVTMLLDICVSVSALSVSSKSVHCVVTMLLDLCVSVSALSVASKSAHCVQMHALRVGHKCVSTPYMSMYLVISLP